MIIGNGPSPSGRITLEVNTSVSPFSVISTVSVLPDNGRSGLEPISYYSISAFISLRRHSQSENVSTRPLPSDQAKGSGKRGLFVSSPRAGKGGCSQFTPVFSCS
jgi:hypothetical protein